MFNQPALSTVETTDMLDMLRCTFEEGAFIVTPKELAALIDSVRDEEGYAVFEVTEGPALTFEMDGNIHSVKLIMRPERDTTQTFEF